MAKTYQDMLDIAIEEARIGFAEKGIPIGAALFHRDGTLLGRGHNRRIQENYQDTIMVTTLAPCWYCSGLVRQFRIMKVIVGESQTFRGGIDWLREHGVEVIDMESNECATLLKSFIDANPEVWNEDIGECTHS